MSNTRKKSKSQAPKYVFESQKLKPAPPTDSWWSPHGGRQAPARAEFFAELQRRYPEMVPTIMPDRKGATRW
jgi:hypothetical protein